MKLPLSNSVRAELASCSGSPRVLSFNVQKRKVESDIINYTIMQLIKK